MGPAGFLANSLQTLSRSSSVPDHAYILTSSDHANSVQCANITGQFFCLILQFCTLLLAFFALLLSTMVTLRASHVVRPAEPRPDEVMYVSEIDQVKPITHAPLVYFYRPTANNKLLLNEIVEILKESLSKVLVPFYPLAGRLYWTSGGRVELRCNSAGALLIEGESDLKIDDFGDFSPTPKIRSLIPSVDYTYTTPIHEVPLFLAQVTKFSCGGICLGLGISHIVSDGQGVALFINEWAKIARSEKSDDPPFLDRKVLQTNEHQPLVLRNLKYSDIFPFPLLLGQSDNLEERKKETTAIILRLSKEQIEALRNKASSDLLGLKQVDKAPKSKANQPPFSRFVVVCAHIWRCTSMARGLQPEQETVLYVTVNFRSRMKPPLPKNYLGNAVIPLPVSSTVGELLSKPLSYAAGKIREAIENVNDEYMRSYLKCIKNIPYVSNLRQFHYVGSQGAFYGNPNLIITSWVGLSLYGIKFGWGDEVFFGPGSLGYDGRFICMTSQDGDGSFLIPLRLQVEHVNAFEKYVNEVKCISKM